MIKVKTILSILFILMVLFSCHSGSDDTDANSSSSWTQEPGSILAVEAMEISRGKLITEVTGSGIVRGFREVTVFSETSGMITESPISPGAYVKEGDTLLKTDDTLAFWNMERAEKQYKTTTFEYEAKKKSYEFKAIAELEYLKAESSWYNSRLNYEQAKKAYEDSTVKAPLSGYVAQMDTALTKGNFIAQGSRIMKIINRDNYILEIYPGQREIGLIQKDSPVSLSIDLADKTRKIEASVLDISGGTNENTGSYPVRITWENNSEGDVLPGMTARVTIETTEAEEGIVIPYDKIMRRDGKFWVYLVQKEDKQESAVPREVTLGTRLGNKILINDGLEEGELLITSGFRSLNPGNLITSTLTGKTGGN